MIEFDHGDRFKAVLDRDRFLTENNNGDVKVWSLDTGECQRTLFNLDDYDLRLWDIDNVTKVDDKRFICGVMSDLYDHDIILMFDVETGGIIQRFEFAMEEEFSFVVVDSERILTMHHNPDRCMVNTWNIHTGECTQTFTTPVHGHGFLSIHGYDPEIKLCEIKLWDDSWNLKRSFSGHTDAVSTIDLVNDTTFVSGSCDDTIKIWDFTRWPDLKTIICLRKLCGLGRAEKLPDARLSERLQEDVHEMLPFLHALVSDMSDDIFITVLSFIA